MAVNETMEKRYSLREWLRIFHPVYRNFLIAMVALGIVGGILTYLNLELLQGLVQTFTAVGRLGTMTCDDAGDLFLLTRIMVCGGVSPGWAIAGIVLLIYVCLELSQAVLGIVSLVVQSKLEITSRNDIEREILLNLMRKDDQFFQRQSATQIANRLEEDTQRMFERREDMAGLWSVFVQALGAIVFLWSQNWSYAAAVLLFSLIGVFIIHRMLGVMRTLDNEQLTSDDNVKAAFEDYLYAVPEAQMGNLSHKIAGQLGHIQVARQTAYMGLVWLNGKLGAVYSITQLVAFTAIMGAIAYVVIVHGFDLRDGLIAAVVRAVPQLYGNISEVAKLVVKFQLAGVSARRLLEYETEFDKTQEPIALAEIGPSTIVLDHVHYAFTPGGPQQGGPEGISLSLAPDELIVVMGPSGSGKTMLCQLIMGRLRAIGGTVHYGDQDIGELSQANRARIFSYMPQTLAMVTGSIRDNLNFGLPQQLTIPEGTMSDETRAWIDRTGVGLFTREKALDLQPDESAVAVIEGIGGLRQQLRQRMKAELGVELVPFTDRALVPHLSILEHITHSAADPDKAARLAFSRAGFKFLDRMAGTPSADAIIGFGQHVVARTQRILSRCPSYESYTELAPYQISEEVWGLRADLASRPEIDLEELATRSEVLLAGLTATPQEADEAFAKRFANALESGEGFQAFVEACTKHFGTALETLDDDKINLSMSWRDNLLFSAPNAVNASLARAIDQKLIEAVAETTLDHELLRGGLEYQVGRQGKRLSGGQRQLICLCRALMRDTPVLVLDEPTAALDPRRRQEMNALLHEIAGKRTVIAITHDAELARVADTVVMVRSGQLWGTGSFSNLCEENADFRRLVRLEEAPV